MTPDPQDRAHPAQNPWLILAGIAGFLGVGFGAIGAHLVSGDPQAEAWLETGAHYQLIHAALLAAIALLGGRLPGWALVWTGGLILVGFLGFSGSLYALGLGAPTGVAMLAPIGGVAYMLAWLVLVIAALRAPNSLKEMPDGKSRP